MTEPKITMPMRYRFLRLACRVLRHPSRRVVSADWHTRESCLCGRINFTDRSFPSSGSTDDVAAILDEIKALRHFLARKMWSIEDGLPDEDFTPYVPDEADAEGTST